MARTRIRFATCNLYNLNEPGKRMYRDANGWTPEEYHQKIAWTANAINSAPADVWAFQELWHRDSLAKVFAEAKLADEFALLIPPNHQGERIVCAAAVKKDWLIGNPEWIVDFPDQFKLSSEGDDPQTPAIDVQINQFSRPVLHFEVKPRSKGKHIHVYVCHFKSKAPTQIYREDWYSKATYSRHSKAIGSALSTIRRTAEATALRMIITERLKDTDTPVVVLGDINDSQHSNTVNILSGQPNHLLSPWRQGGSDVDLYSIATLQEYRSLRDVYYTHIYKNTRESLDHILVSEQFYDNSRKRLWAFKGMDIINDHLNEENHKETGTTDHGIVRATFEYRPAK